MEPVRLSVRNAVTPLGHFLFSYPRQKIVIVMKAANLYVCHNGYSQFKPHGSHKYVFFQLGPLQTMNSLPTESKVDVHTQWISL